MAALLLLAVVSCSEDPEVDSVPRVGFAQEALTVDGDGGDVSLDVICNSYWALELTDTDGESVRWVTADRSRGMGDATVTLTATRNRSDQARVVVVNIRTEAQNASKTILLTQSGGGAGDVEGYSFPVWQMFDTDESLLFDAGYISEGRVVFDNGMVITRTDGAPFTFVCPILNHDYDAGFNAGAWDKENADLAWKIEIPLKESLSGDLRLLYGSRDDGWTASPKIAWTGAWSTDDATYTAFDGPATTSAANALFHALDFSIPEQKAVPAGGKLYLKLYPTSTSAVTTPSLEVGISLRPQKIEPGALPPVDNETVVFSTSFDELNDAPAAPAFTDDGSPAGYMTSGFCAYSYSGQIPDRYKGILSVLRCYARPGSLRLSNATGNASGYVKVVLSHLKEMNISNTDLKVTFRAAGYRSATGAIAGSDIRVEVDRTSGASVDDEGKAGATEPNVFKEYTVYVRNAKPETEVTIINRSTAADTRYFLDDILIEVEGEPTRPSADDPVESSISALRAKKGASAVTVSDNIFVKGRVVATDNMPAGCFALADDNAGIFVRMADHGLAVGDMAEVVAKNAELATDADGLLIVTPAAADKVRKSSVASQAPVAKSVSVEELKAGTYEAMYVALPASQVVEADLGKTLAGDVTLQLEDLTTTYTMKTYPSASFASASVPQGAGIVRGVAGASFLLPASNTDLASMNGVRYGEAVYAIEPICGMIRMMGTGMATFCNVTYDEATKTVAYTDNGCSIRKLGNADVAGSGLTHTTNAYDGRFTTTGWGGAEWEENALLFKIKATSILKGRLRFGFGLFAASSQLVPKNYKIEWSTDDATWSSDAAVYVAPFLEANRTSTDNSFSIPTAANYGGYKMAVFDVPESKAVPAGGYLYVRIRQADNTICHKSGGKISTSGLLQFQHCFYLSTHEKRAYHTNPLPSGSDVVFAYGFDECFYGHDYFIPTCQMSAGASAGNNYPNVYAAPAGWELSGDVREMPGFIRIGTASASASVTTPPLTALGDTPTDVTLTFKLGIHMGQATTYKPEVPGVDFAVTATVGTVGTLRHDFASLPAAKVPMSAAEVAEMDAAYHKWHDVTVKISGATKDTRITVTGGVGRHYIDDIVVVKD